MAVRLPQAKRNLKLSLGVLAAVATFVAARAASSQPDVDVATDERPPAAVVRLAPSVNGVDVEAVLHAMTVEQKVGQLLFVDFAGQEISPKLVRLIAGMKVGGVALFSRNIRNRQQVRKLVRSINQLDLGGVLPFISVDQEGGNVIRIKDPEAVLPSAMALGATGDVALARDAGKVVGRDLRALGLTMNLAPVLDVNSNPENPVIGVRSFGEQPELVADMGVAFIQGLRDVGIIAVAKHFPGHGATAADSHYGLPSLTYDLERLQEVEFLPFKRAIGGGLEALMTAHIALPMIAEAPDLPATLSRRIISDVLRRDIGFDGIVITDGLEMRGIVERYGLGRAAVKAVLAGADMVLIVWTTERKEEVRQALLDAVAGGEIPSARLDQSVRRVLNAKARHMLFPGQTPIALDTGVHERGVNAEIARRSLTLVRNEGGVLPLRKVRVSSVVVASQLAEFGRHLGKNLTGIKVKGISLRWAPDRARRLADSSRVMAAATTADAVVVGLSNIYYHRLVRSLKQQFPDKPVIVVSFGTPYMLRRFPAVDAYLCTYSSLKSSQTAAAQLLAGQIEPSGRLPVTLPGLYPFGHGLTYAPAGERETGGLTPGQPGPTGFVAPHAQLVVE